MIIREIPLVPRNQRLTVDINGTSYILLVSWNRSSGCWIMDIHDALDNKLLCGVPLVTGANLLEQFGTNISMVVVTIAVGHSPDEVPTYANLGLDGHLYYGIP
jgi:hypothetical protein